MCSVCVCVCVNECVNECVHVCVYMCTCMRMCENQFRNSSIVVMAYIYLSNCRASVFMTSVDRLSSPFSLALSRWQYIKTHTHKQARTHTRTHTHTPRGSLPQFCVGTNQWMIWRYPLGHWWGWWRHITSKMCAPPLIEHALSDRHCDEKQLTINTKTQDTVF